MSDVDDAGSKARVDFHTHLDECRRCANHPFDLCEEGARLVELAAAEAIEQTASEPEK